MMQRVLLLSILLIISSASYSDVLVKTRESGIGPAEIKISLLWARLTNLSSPQQFMLINLKEKQTYMVDRNQKVMIRMDGADMPDDGTQHSRMTDDTPTVELKNAGDGPSIAGFKTEKYLLTADGKICSIHYISKEALKLPEMKAFAENIERLAKAPQYLAEHNTSCEYADIRFEQMAFENGIPLLSTNAAGKETFRVLEINTKANFAITEVAPPQGYERVTPQQMMHRQVTRALGGRKE